MGHAAFPESSWRSYLNFAGVGTLAASTRAALVDAVCAQERGGVGAMGAWLPAAQRARERAAALLGVGPAQVGLVRSTSEAIQAVAHGLRWRPGDRIVLFEGEFPSNVVPWMLAARRQGLDVRTVPAAAFAGTSGDGEQRLREALVGGARLVAVSAVQFQTGLRMPTDAITAAAHAAGAEVLIDAIQAVGALPFSAGDADYVACGGHKWLMGPMGTAVLYARDWARLDPALASWLSQEHALDFLSGAADRLDYAASFQVGPAIVEGSAQNFIGFAGLAQALALAIEADPAQTFAHAQLLIDNAESGLVARGFVSHRPAVPAQRANILALSPPAGSPLTLGGWAQALGERGVCVATPDGRLRVAPSWPNGPDDVATLLDAVDALLG